jgi:hypothetical protein
MSVHLRYCLFILLIAAGCNKADFRVPPTPPLKDPETVDDVFPDCDPELTAEYKGGTAAWLKFLSENLTYPDSAINAEIQGTIRVSFAIEKDGRVSIIQPPGGPGVLQMKPCALSASATAAGSRRCRAGGPLSPIKHNPSFLS